MGGIEEENADARRGVLHGPLGAQSLEYELARPPAVGVATSRAHHLSDEEPDHLLVAGADPLGLVGVGGDHLVHHPAELIRADRGESLALDDGGGRRAGIYDAVEDVLGGGARDG